MDGHWGLLDRWLARARGSRDKLRDLAATCWIDWTQSPGEMFLPGASVAAATLLTAIVLTFHIAANPNRHARFVIPLLTTALFGLIFLAWRLLDTGWSSSRDDSSSRWLTGCLSLPLWVLAGGLVLSRHAQFLWPLSAALLALVIGITGSRFDWRHWTTSIRRAIHTIRHSLFEDKEHSFMTTVLDARPSGHPRIAAESAHGLHPIHWMQRTIDSLGTEHLKGVTLVEFQSGQSFLTAHIPFCPPFAQTPVFECHPVTQEEVRVRASVAYPYGARIELKRQGSCQGALSVEVEFSAVSAQMPSRAA